MEQKINIIPKRNTKVTKEKRVCAYARVSVNNPDMLHSLGAQISFYMDYINNHIGWTYAGVFHDKPTTGTKDNRPEFQRMIDKCRSGEIDMIITKSVSRFARNIVTTIAYSRELKALGIDIFFEEENIHTLSAQGELTLSLFAAHAQAVSIETSENCKWRIQKKFENGEITDFKMLGYDWVNGKLIINPEGAAIVKRIFNEYLSGKGVILISKGLENDGIVSINGIRIGPSSVRKILSNEKYAGDLLLQKTFYNNTLEKKKIRNSGQKNMYMVEGSHKPIIDKETFNAVQEKIQKRSSRYHHSPTTNRYAFSGLITCGNCGVTFTRKPTRNTFAWVCRTYNLKGKSACASKKIPEDILIQETAKVLGLKQFDETIFKKKIKGITALNGNRLIFLFTDGTERTCVWQDKSRADSWTPEMKQKASEQRRQSA